ncbi:MAG: DNA gyrase subunit A [Planctomycetota bacterium]|nr:MAG: DNA gyrase subunit A [Planctomycetota bacterium]RLS98405.1 MAG: DNA gyrase subunit A [Planctomycetota bacterium]
MPPHDPHGVCPLVDEPMPSEVPSPSPGEDALRDNAGGLIIEIPIEQELKESYLTYAMSVIVSRALPDVRDGLKPSQRRILVAMNDLNLSPGSSRVKCAKISGDTSGNYHPHGESVIYPTLVRMAQEWNMRHVLVDKQGNFGSIAGLPAAAMRYTEARLSPIAALLLDDLDLDTVDFVPTYDERSTEPVVLPSRFPNLVVNGAGGIAVGMATSIPPHNLGEVCKALVQLIDFPNTTAGELLQIVPGPDFPTGGIVMGRDALIRGYLTGRSTITLRARATVEDMGKNRSRIVVTEVPYQQTRDSIEEKIAELVTDDRIKGISAIRNESDLKDPVRLVLELKRDADPEVVLNQLYQFSSLQTTFSLIFLALVDGKPRILPFKKMLEEFLRHRTTVIRRRTQHLLAKARSRKHTLEGLLVALANLDEVIAIIRSSPTQAEAKQRLTLIAAPSSLLERAIGEEGFAVLQEERGVSETYGLSPVQAEAILRLTLGQLVNLEQTKLSGEHRELLIKIGEFRRILSSESNIRALIREELLDLENKHADERRTEISGEAADIRDMAELITEASMVVTISRAGYIKRTGSITYRAQRRGGKGLTGARTDDEDPIEHLFVASTHDWLLVFTTLGKVFTLRVFELPELARDARGRALVNLLELEPGEKVADCRAVGGFEATEQYLMLATRRGVVKKTALEQYSRKRSKGLIAVKLREGDELIDALVTCAGDELVLSTANGLAIRFPESDVRPMGRGTSGVRGIRLSSKDRLVGMVVADPEATLLTVCSNGFGKRTLFGVGTAISGPAPTGDEESIEPEVSNVDSDITDDESSGSQVRYRTQHRGGKGVRDIKTTARNGEVVAVVSVRDEDEVLMMTSRGKIQRVAVREIKPIGRNTQGVRIMRLDEGDSLAAVVRVPPDDRGADSPESTEEPADPSPQV